MKNRINLLAICFLIAGMSLVPAAHAACAVTSLAGTWGYELRGYLGGSNYIPPVFNTYTQVGLLNADAAGHFTNTYTLSDSETETNIRGSVTQGTYFQNADCSFTVIFHGNPVPCVHFSVIVNPLPPPVILLGSLTPGPPLVFVADATMSCTDQVALTIIGGTPEPPVGSGPYYPSSNYTGTMTRQ